MTWKRRKPSQAETSDRPKEQDYIDGRLFSYIEMLAILRASTRDSGIDLKSIG
ncbi:hypothetical protein [Spirosoma litoris]